ncbi:hypothetical protein V6N13_071195 [Hibiscus sabdariffa]
MNDDYLCRHCILNSLSDNMYYQFSKKAKTGMGMFPGSAVIEDAEGQAKWRQFDNACCYREDMPLGDSILNPQFLIMVFDPSAPMVTGSVLICSPS